MKKLLWTVVLLASLGSSLWAQNQYTYVTNPGSGTPVRLFDSPTLAPLPASPTGADPIVCASGVGRVVGIASRNKIYVANRQAAPGVVTIIDTQILKIVNTVTLSNSSLLGGMSVSEDGSTLFIAGRNPTLGEAGVFSLNLNDEITQAYVGGLASASTAADCEVIPASLVGGVGNGAGRIYFSIPANNVIGVRYLAGPTGPATIAPPAGSTSPGQMERAPDGTFVLIGCGSTNINNRTVIHVLPSAGASTTTLLSVVIGFGMSPQTDDVTFRSSIVAPPFTAYFCTQDPSGQRVHEISVDGTGLLSDKGSTVLGTTGNGIAYDPFTDRVYVADQSGTGNQFTRLTGSTSPPSAPVLVNAGSTGPLGFAFMPAPPDPLVDFASPTAEVSTAPFQIEIRGSGFIPGSSKAQIFNLSVPVDATTTTVVNSNTIRATFPIQAGGLLWHVIVINNSGRSDQVNQYFETMNANPPAGSFSLPLPSVGQGYQLLSLPQYAQVGDLQAALSAQLGPYSPILYRVFLYQNARYVELNQADPSSFADLTGKGFWALTRNGHLLTMAAPDVSQNTPGGRRVIPLVPGFNMVSQPWINGPTNTIDYSLVQVSANGNLVPLGSASTSLFVSNQPFEFVGGRYLLVNQMTAGKAYWIQNTSASTVYMVIDRANVLLKPGPGSGPVYSSLAAGASTPPPPPGAALGDSSTSSGGGCGLTGADGLFLALLGAFLLRRRAR